MAPKSRSVELTSYPPHIQLPFRQMYSATLSRLASWAPAKHESKKVIAKKAITVCGWVERRREVSRDVEEFSWYWGKESSNCFLKEPKKRYFFTMSENRKDRGRERFPLRWRNGY